MIFSKIFCIPCFLSLILRVSTTEAFVPTLLKSHPTSALHVSVVSNFLTKDEAEQKLKQAFEDHTPESVGVQEIADGSPESHSTRGRKRSRRRNHNYSEKTKFLQEKPDTDFYTLHSSAVSHLQRDTPINDIMRAIKRAQNLHDGHDLGTIAAFLIDECDENWGYGFRGSLLSRLAVAALHMQEIEIANSAINTRRVYERPSMQPYESAAIVRGLMRANKIDKAWIVLEDELRLPLEGTDLTSPENKEILKHRALTLASIVSRHFYNGEPYISAQAIESLGALGALIDKSHMEGGELDIPWSKLMSAATDCEIDECEHVDSGIDLPLDLTELVFNAMSEFPCHGEKEECSLEDFLD